MAPLFNILSLSTWNIVWNALSLRAPRAVKRWAARKEEKVKRKYLIILKRPCQKRSWKISFTRLKVRSNRYILFCAPKRLCLFFFFFKNFQRPFCHHPSLKKRKRKNAKHAPLLHHLRDSTGCCWIRPTTKRVAGARVLARPRRLYIKIKTDRKGLLDNWRLYLPDTPVSSPHRQQ